MQRLSVMARRARGLFTKSRLEAEMAEEMQAHLEGLVARHLAAGLSPEEARHAAQRQFGGVEQIKEQARDVRGIRWLEDFFRDLGFAARSLRQAPGLTAVVVLSLALGIGANTAVFSVVNAVLLRPLPFPEPERLVRVQWLLPDGSWFAVPHGDFFDWREQNRVFADIAAISPPGWGNTTLTDSDGAERVLGLRVTANYFSLLGIKPALGRTFLPEEDKQPATPVVVLSYGMWLRRFGLDPNIVGKKLTLDGKSHDIVGIMPAGFKISLEPGEPSPDIWQTCPFTEIWPMNERSSCNLRVLARLKPGISVAQAQAEMDTIHARIEREFRKARNSPKVVVKPMHDWLVGKDRMFHFVLLGAVGLVLLIAAANVANLLLARAAARQKEIAVRLALGASRGRIIRQLMTEALLLAVLGGAVGTIVAVASLDALVQIIPADTPRADEIGIDLRVLGFTAFVTVLTGLLFGLVPALKASKADRNDALNQSGRGGMGGAGSQVLRHALIVVEVGLALMLLVGAGLMLHSLARMLAIDHGIRSDKVLVAKVKLPQRVYATKPVVESASGTDRKVWSVRPEKTAFIDQLLLRIEALPGVVSAAVSSVPPLSEERLQWRTIRIEGRPELTGAPKPRAAVVSVTARYFETVGMRLLQGRHFTDRDRDGAPGVAIASEMLVRKYWPNEDPIGKRVTTMMGRPFMDERDYEIVGIVTDAAMAVEGGSQATMFIPIDQQGKKYVQPNWSWALSFDILVRTAGEPTAIAAAVRAAIKEVDPNQPLEQVTTVREIISRQFSARSFAMVLLSLFASVALVLSAAGIYGVTAYAVTQRTHEIGVRMALGASRRDVLEMVIRHGIRFALLGVALGLAGAIATTHLLKSLLYEITPTDPLTAAIVTLLLTGVAFLACYIPARRATKVDPMVALRCE